MYACMYVGLVTGYCGKLLGEFLAVWSHGMCTIQREDHFGLVCRSDLDRCRRPAYHFQPERFICIVCNTACSRVPRRRR